MAISAVEDFSEIAADTLPPRTHNAAPLEEVLLEQSALLAARRDDLLSAAERAPTVIEDEETCGKIADLVRLIAACSKAAEGQRVAAKEPWLASSRLVDAVYKRITDPLDRAKRAVEQRLTAYQRVKAEAERRRREEEARRRAEEEARARRVAEEAAKVAQTEPELDVAIVADEVARQAAADAALAQKVAAAKPAELSRSRGDYGAVASLRTFIDFTDLDRNKIDLETLRPYLAVADVEKAIRGFIRAGGRELRGCRIFENTSTQVR